MIAVHPLGDSMEAFISNRFCGCISKPNDPRILRHFLYTRKRITGKRFVDDIYGHVKT